MLLEINNLSVQTEKSVQILKNISLHVDKGEFIAVVGESGSGKTMTSLALMHLLPENIKKTGGEILFHGKEISEMSQKEFLQHTGKDITIIFQEPMTSLNPLMKVGKQIEETGLVHGMKKAEAKAKKEELMKKVGFEDSDRISESFPHQLSGGMKQRVMIASALMNTPELLIADEPTTALDVSTQEEIIEILQRLKQDSDVSMLLITHDFTVVKKLCTRVYVMFQGEIVEENTVEGIFANPKHPYTKALIESIPDYSKKGKDLPVYFRGEFENV